MANPLELSSFVPIYETIVSPDAWDSRIKRDLETLSSLSTVYYQRKYHFSQEDFKFHLSSWQFADSLKGWIGRDWGEWLEAKEEAAFRTVRKLSIMNAIDGITCVKHRIVKTLAIASRSLDPENPQQALINLPLLETQIISIRDKLYEANRGLERLKCTYELNDKHEPLEPVVADFCKELLAFVNKVLSQIKERKNVQEIASAPKPFLPEPSHSLPPRSVEGQELASAAKPETPPIVEPVSQPPIMMRPLPIPFFNPKNDEQKRFNRDLEKNFSIMEDYLREHLPRIQREMTMSKENFWKDKNKDEKKPWTLLITREGRVYVHFHISIVPKGEGGQFKKDKRAYCYCPTMQVDIAKLSTKIIDEKTKRTTENEAKFLKFCFEKKLPHVVPTYDIFTIKRVGKLDKHVICQYYCAHGNLGDSLVRLCTQPDKIKEIILGSLKGLAALHRYGIVHNDLKPANIFLDENDIPFIGDLGLACNQNDIVEYRGTPLYMDPDLIKNLGQRKASAHFDMWSFGMILYGLLTNPTEKWPWPWLKNAHSANGVVLLNNTLKDKLFLEPKKDDVLMGACWEMLQLDPSKRPTAQELVDRLEKLVPPPK